MTADPNLLKVLKFGGSSFIDLSDYGAVARYVTGMLTSAGIRVVVVVSGMSGSTGRLLDAALSIDPGLRPQVQDEVLATAEMVSASFMRAALNAGGCPATSLWASQAGIRSDSAATHARIVSVDPGPVSDALAEHRVVVVAGGQATDNRSRVTMLGRNSSDLTAVALAAALSAGECDIFGDTPGIFTADPYVVPSARLQAQLTYQQCVAMAESGAKVLHWGAVGYAQRHGVLIRSRPLDAALAGAAAPGTSVGAGEGQTAVVGNAQVQVYRLPPSTDIAVMAGALRAANLVAHPVDHDGATLLACPSGQDPGRSLAELGLDAEQVDGFGLVSVVGPDGATTRRLVDREQVNRVVAAEHELIYGRPAGGQPALALAKRRSSYSALLLGRPGPSADIGNVIKGAP